MSSYKHLVLVWHAGAGGDLVNSFFTHNSHFFAAQSGYSVNHQGRMIPLWNQQFLNQFPLQPGLHHNTRDWAADLDNLAKLDRPCLITTARPDQAQLLKNRFESDVCVVSINYQPNMWSFVAKGFCHKVLDSPNYLTRDSVGERFLNTVAKTAQEREFFIELGQTGKLGLWYAKHLINGDVHYPPTRCMNECDVAVDLEQLFDLAHLISHLSNIANCFDVKVDVDSWSGLYYQWWHKQDLYYSVNVTNHVLRQVLGYNSLATAAMPDQLELQAFDRMLLAAKLQQPLDHAVYFQDVIDLTKNL